MALVLMACACCKNARAEQAVIAKGVALKQSSLEQFLRKWEPVSRPEFRQNKELERFG
jgi:hypothetical protein